MKFVEFVQNLKVSSYWGHFFFLLLLLDGGALLYGFSVMGSLACAAVALLLMIAVAPLVQKVLGEELRGQPFYLPILLAFGGLLLLAVNVVCSIVQLDMLTLPITVTLALYSIAKKKTIWPQGKPVSLFYYLCILAILSVAIGKILSDVYGYAATHAFCTQDSISFWTAVVWGDIGDGHPVNLGFYPNTLEYHFGVERIAALFSQWAGVSAQQSLYIYTVLLMGFGGTIAFALFLVDKISPSKVVKLSAFFLLHYASRALNDSWFQNLIPGLKDYFESYSTKLTGWYGGKIAGTIASQGYENVGSMYTELVILILVAIMMARKWELNMKAWPIFAVMGACIGMLGITKMPGFVPLFASLSVLTLILFWKFKNKVVFIPLMVALVVGMTTSKFSGVSSSFVDIGPHLHTMKQLNPAIKYDPGDPFITFDLGDPHPALEGKKTLGYLIGLFNFFVLILHYRLFMSLYALFKKDGEPLYKLLALWGLMALGVGFVLSNIVHIDVLDQVDKEFHSVVGNRAIDWMQVLHPGCMVLVLSGSFALIALLKGRRRVLIVFAVFAVLFSTVRLYRQVFTKGDASVFYRIKLVNERAQEGRFEKMREVLSKINKDQDVILCNGQTSMLMGALGHRFYFFTPRMVNYANHLEEFQKRFRLKKAFFTGPENERAQKLEEIGVSHVLLTHDEETMMYDSKIKMPENAELVVKNETYALYRVIKKDF